jgi:hypothetical protein
MMRWLFPYGIWYAVAAWTAYLAAEAAGYGDIFGAAFNGGIAVLIAVTVIRSQLRWSRSGEKALRAELVRLVDERARADVPWLHRDAHLIFATDRRRVAAMPERMLMMADEDQVSDLEDARHAGGGKVALTAVYYRAHPMIPRVLRRVNGTTALVTAADIEQADPVEHRTWRGKAVAAVRELRTGVEFADAAELAEVIGQFRDAEPFSHG